jgi:hypothetical protein
MEFLTRGHLLADVSAILSSLDILFGEIDRRFPFHVSRCDRIGP